MKTKNFKHKKRTLVHHKIDQRYITYILPILQKHYIYIYT